MEGWKDGSAGDMSKMRWDLGVQKGELRCVAPAGKRVEIISGWMGLTN